MKTSLRIIATFLISFSMFAHAGEGVPEKKLKRIAKKHTQAPLRILKSAHVNLTPQEVFNMVSDHEAIPSWLPMIHDVEIDNTNAVVENGLGCVRSCTMADGGKLTEKIVHWKPGKSYAYAIADGNPMGLQNHLGIFSVKKDGKGSILSWAQFFDHPQPEMVGPQISGLMDIVLNKFVTDHGGMMLAALD